jgi:solute carrier family 6 amino acid transporter-like protein 5/7/9/14
VIIAAANSGTSVFAGFVIFAILGFMAGELGVPVDEVVEGGTGLAFVAYPTAVTRLPCSPLWSFLFFTMLLTLGLDSQFTMVESLITAAYDEAPWLRRRPLAVVGTTCLAGFLLGLPMCLQGGLYIFVLMDWYSGSWSLIFLAVLEVLVVAWLYGVQRLRRDIHHMGIRTPRAVAFYWDVSWRALCPLLLSCVMVASLVDYTPAREGDYLFPPWANAIGWCIAVSSVLAVLPASLAEVVAAVRSGLPLSHLFTPDRMWRDENTNLAIKAGYAAMLQPAEGDKEAAMQEMQEKPMHHVQSTSAML